MATHAGHGSPRRRIDQVIPAPVTELMRTWVGDGFTTGTRSWVGDPGRIWGRAARSVERPGPAGAPIDDLIAYLRNEVRQWSSSTGEDDPTTADPALVPGSDAGGTSCEGRGRVLAPLAVVGSRRLPADERCRHQTVTDQVVTSDLSVEPALGSRQRSRGVEPVLAR